MGGNRQDAAPTPVPPQHRRKRVMPRNALRQMHPMGAHINRQSEIGPVAHGHQQKPPARPAQPRQPLPQRTAHLRRQVIGTQHHALCPSHDGSLFPPARAIARQPQSAYTFEP
ncbi:MAG: hypothetical protein FD149_1729 [Rhodospirillaceae bacterium]|nr:MAG: hypothetical protein FD149_1729 [Rhodospirillaceae bacterium]